MKRREFITLLGASAAAWPPAARAQQAKGVRRLAVLFGSSTEVSAPFLVSVRKRLSESGWVEGRNLHIDVRWGEGDVDRLRTFAAELVGLAPDAILAQSTLALDALRQRTDKIPLIFTQVSDPVRGGFVSNLARPEGNITGFTNFEYEMSGKWLETLKEIAPKVITVLVLADPAGSGSGHLAALEAVAASAAVRLQPIVVRKAADIVSALNAASQTPNLGIIVLPGVLAGVNRKLILEWAGRARVPAIYAYRYFVAEGGLLSYGFDAVEQHRQAASYIDRIFRGTKPGELPVQAPTKFELVINLKTAKALGLDVPPMLLATADEVIE
jgi:putative tryptophan/tyrosine transport system substrate-binding protein